MGKAEKIEFRSWKLEFHTTCLQAMSCAWANRERTGALTKNKGGSREVPGVGGLDGQDGQDKSEIRSWDGERFLAVFSGILSPNRRKPVACGAHNPA